MKPTKDEDDSGLLGYFNNVDAELIQIIVKYGILSVIWIHICIGVWAHWRQLRLMGNHRHVPDEFVGFTYPPEGFRLSKNYTYQNLTLRSKTIIVRGAIITGILLSNGLATLWNFCEKLTLLIVALPVLSKYDYHPTFHTHLTNIIFTFIYTVLERILQYWPELEEFDTERYFGFSRTSNRRWMRNFIRVSILKICIWPIYLEICSSVLQYLNLQILHKNWIHLSIMGFFYWLIFPMFFVFLALSNTRQIRPLPEGDLRTRINNLADRVKFPKDCIFVLHSTQAKSHPNAFHIKFLRYERLILFESLMEPQDQSAYSLMGKGLSDEQVEAVVAHELGHYQLSHGFLGVTYLQLKTLFSCLLTMWLMQNSVLHEVIGLGDVAPEFDVTLPGLIAEDLFISQYALAFLDFLFAIYQRRTELKADEYAAKLGYGHMLESALVKISTDNFIFPDHDPVYSVVNCTHPSMLTRIRNIRKNLMDPMR